MGTFLAGLKCSWPTVLWRCSKEAGRQGSKEGRYKITPCRFGVSATRPDSTNMELLSRLLDWQSKPSPSCSESSSQTSSSEGRQANIFVEAASLGLRGISPGPASLGLSSLVLGPWTLSSRPAEPPSRRLLLISPRRPSAARPRTLHPESAITTSAHPKASTNTAETRGPPEHLQYTGSNLTNKTHHPAQQRITCLPSPYLDPPALASSSSDGLQR